MPIKIVLLILLAILVFAAVLFGSEPTIQGTKFYDSRGIYTGQIVWMDSDSGKVIRQDGTLAATLHKVFPGVIKVYDARGVYVGTTNQN